ncbi:nuclear transport factor 2 family protein [Paractinoplanes durhamensis]|uniref:nuclear transport factor 2 family protein n=1 Tax=Paractinoplanes durhamensis TaxID=113563 RepID=UPI003635C3D5
MRCSRTGERTRSPSPTASTYRWRRRMPAGELVDAATRKRLALDYCRLMNSGDVDGVLQLFAPDVRFEDPVGWTPVHGRAALRTHLATAIAARVHEVPGCRQLRRTAGTSRCRSRRPWTTCRWAPGSRPRA